MRRLLFVVTVLATLSVATAALAGGAVWHFEGYHEPGDTVESTTSIAWNHNSDLGKPSDGPYFLYLAPQELDPPTWPGIPEGAMLVGIVEAHEGPYVGSDGELYGPHHAVARFEIPDVDPGVYQILHCNDPCTSTLADIVGGWDLRVVGGNEGRPADVIAAEVKARAATAPLLLPPDPSATTTTTTTTTTAPASVAPSDGTASEMQVALPAQPESVSLDTHVAAGAATALTGPTGEADRFDSLWRVVVVVVVALLVVRMALDELRWRRWPEKSWNETGVARVLTDD